MKSWVETATPKIDMAAVCTTCLLNSHVLATVFLNNNNKKVFYMCLQLSSLIQTKRHLLMSVMLKMKF